MKNKTSFDALEIYPCKRMGDEAVVVKHDRDADFFSLFGLVMGDVNGYYMPIGDYSTRAQAELTRDHLE